MCLHPWEVMDATPQRAIRQIVPGRFLCNPSECAAAMALQHMDDVARFRVQHAGDELRLFPTPRAGRTGWHWRSSRRSLKSRPRGQGAANLPGLSSVGVKGRFLPVLDVPNELTGDAANAAPRSNAIPALPSSLASTRAKSLRRSISESSLQPRRGSTAPRCPCDALSTQPRKAACPCDLETVCIKRYVGWINSSLRSGMGVAAVRF